MPRVGGNSAIGGVASACDDEDSVPFRSKPLGFGEGVCSCARCMRKAGPLREDVE